MTATVCIVINFPTYRSLPLRHAAVEGSPLNGTRFTCISFSVHAASSIIDVFWSRRCNGSNCLVLGSNNFRGSIRNTAISFTFAGITTNVILHLACISLTAAVRAPAPYVSIFISLCRLYLQFLYITHPVPLLLVTLNKFV